LLKLRANYCIKIIVLVALLSIYSTASAATELTEEDFFEELPIILNASRLTQTLNESPVPVTIINRDMIEASGLTEIAEVFRLIPGFVADYYRGNINLTGYLFIDDSLPRMMQVMVDGRSIYTPTLGGPVWSSLPLNIDDIDRIEAVRGPNAASYGSNAYLGVINIITRSPATIHGWSTRLNAGEPNLREASLRYGGQSEKWSYRFSGWNQMQEGFKGLHDGKSSQMFSSRVESQLDNNNHIDIQFGASYVNNDRDEPDDPSTPNHEITTRANFQMIKWDRTLNKDKSFHLKYFHNYDESVEYVTLNIPGIGLLPINQNYKSHRHDLELQINNNLSPDIHLAYGGSIRKDTIKTPTFLGKFSPVDIDIYRAFIHGYWNINKHFFANAGLMVENTDISNTNVLPLASLHYRLTDRDTIRLSATRGSRLPVAFEEYADTRISIPGTSIFDQIFFENSDLNSETIDTINIGLIGKQPEAGLSYDVSYSHHKLRHLLTFDSTNFADTFDGRAIFFDDQGEVDIDNVEFSIGYSPWRHTRFDAAYAYTEAREKNIVINSETVDKATPRHNFSLLVRHKINSWYKFSAAYYYIDRARYIDNQIIRPATDRLDIRLARKLKFSNIKGELALVGQDLLNNYQGIYINNKMDRRFYASLKLDFP